jgi:glutamyl-tRNA reductase
MIMRIALLVVSHKTATIKDIERIIYEDIEEAYSDLASTKTKEFLILQTCHRFELYVNAMSPLSVLEEYAKKRSIKDCEILAERDAIEHLMRLSCGLESLVIGEDQILGQIKDAYIHSIDKNYLNDKLKIIFDRAIKTGKRARKESKINEGSVSIGSVAVRLAEEIFGGLKNKKILVIGAGEIATLVAKSLSNSGKAGSVVFVANRTFENAKCLASEVGGFAVRFDEKERYLADSDLVITATGAPHTILDYDTVKRVVEGRDKPLLIIDIANPRDVEEKVASIKGVSLYNIDSLRGVSKTNLEKRMGEIEKVENLIGEEIERLEETLRERELNDIIAKIYDYSEEIRKRELGKAIEMIDFPDENTEKIMDDMARAIKNKILAKPVERMRYLARNGDLESVKIFSEILK